MTNLDDDIVDVLSETLQKVVTISETDEVLNVLDIIIEKVSSKNDLYKYDEFYPWTEKSKDVDFESKKKCIGNGEEKIAKELNITSKLGGQNSTVDLKHTILGEISVKDMTKDDCTLGTEGSELLKDLFIDTAFLLLRWVNKFKNKSNYIYQLNDRLNKSYGRSTISISKGIKRFELSSSNLNELNLIFNELISKSNEEDLAIKSEYYIDIINKIKETTLIEECNKLVRKEAEKYTLIIAHKENGWLIVKNINKITCPRITHGAPRIKYDF